MGEQTIILDHEGRLGIIETKLTSVQEEVSKNTVATEKGFDKITKLIQGDNGEGLATRIAVNDTHARDNIKRLWWMIPILFVVATTIISYLV